MTAHNPRCAIFNEPPGLRSAQDCNCGAIPPLSGQLNVYRDALADIEGILRTPEWSQGMLEDIAAIVKRTGVKHNSPPPYHHH